MKIHIRYKDTEPFYEVDCVPEIGCDIIQIIATDPYRFTADGWRVNVTQDEDCGLLAIASAELQELAASTNAGVVEVRVDPKSINFMRLRFYPHYLRFYPHYKNSQLIVLYGSVGEELARWEVK